MKLHLPKSLFIAVLAAVVSTPLLTWGETITMNPFEETGWHEAYRYDENASNKDLSSITFNHSAGTAELGGNWHQNRATYVLEELMQADQSTSLTFSLSITPGGSGGLYGIALVGKHQTIAFGDLEYNNTKLQYGVGNDVSSDFYLESGNDWDNCTGGVIQTSSINDITSTGGQSYKLDGAIEWDATQNTYVMTLTYNDGATPAATVNLGSSADVSKIIVYTDGVSAKFSDFTLTGAAGSLYDLIWSGSNENNTWSSLASPWQGGVDVSSASDYILFDALSEGRADMVIISGDVEAGKISINDDYSFKTEGEGSISATLGIEIADGKKMSVTGGALTIDGSITGDVSVNGGALTIDGSITGDVSVNGGTLTIDGAITGDVSLNGGNLNISGQGAIGGGKLEIQNGTVQASLTANSNMSVIKAGTEISIKTGGMLSLEGHDMLGWGTTSPAKILLKSESNAEDKLAKLHFQDSGATTLASDIEMQGNTLVTGNTINTFGTDFIASGTNNKISIGEIKVRDTLNITVTDDGDELTISSKLTAYGSSSQNIVKKGEGTLILSGTNTYTGGTTIEQGRIQITSGAELGSGSVEIQQSGVLEINTPSNSSIAGDVTLKDGGTMIVKNGYSQNQQANVDILVENSGRIESGWGGDNGSVGGSISGAGTLELACPVWDDTYSTNAWKLNATVSDKSASEKLAVSSNTNVTMGGDNSYSGGTVIQGYTLTTKHENALGSGKVSLEGGMLKLAEDLSLSAMDLLAGSVNNGGYKLNVSGVLRVGEGQELAAPATGGMNVGTLQLDSGASATMGAGLTVSNLSLSSGSKVTMGSALTMGSNAAPASEGDAVSTGYTLSLEKGITLKLKDDLLTQIGNLTASSEPLVLITGVNTLQLGDQTYTVGSQVLTDAKSVSLSDYITIEGFENYYVSFNSEGSVIAGLSVPEPTTTTLSLLALAGLCARRRRK